MINKVWRYLKNAIDNRQFEGAIKKFLGFEATLFVDIGSYEMYKIYLGKMDLLIDFLCFISSNKVHPKPRNSIIALSNMKTFKNFKKVIKRNK